MKAVKFTRYKFVTVSTAVRRFQFQKRNGHLDPEVVKNSVGDSRRL
jgi:hypothetical protein